MELSQTSWADWLPSRGASIVRYDGATGQPAMTFVGDGTVASLPGTGPSFVVHPDGTIIAATSTGLIGIDPITGAQKFTAPMDIPEDTPDYPVSGVQEHGLIIGGDGYAYLVYGYGVAGDEFDVYLKVLRVNSSGAYDNIPVWNGPLGYDPDVLWLPVKTITNSDVGILLSGVGVDSTGAWGVQMATVAGTSASVVEQPQIPGYNRDPVVPLLQAQDGSFVGMIGTCLDEGCNTYQNYMIAFDTAGTVQYTVPGDIPQIATADGGVVAQSGLTYDQIGNVQGQVDGLLTQSWTAKEYSSATGFLSQVAQPPILWASSFQSVTGGNPSQNGTSAALLVWVEGLPLWAAARGPRCQLGTNKPALAGNALQKYNILKQALMTGGYLTSPTCSAFFNGTRSRAAYFSQLGAAVNQQAPYDALQTTISVYDAGLWTAKQAATNPIFPRAFQRSPVCGNFGIGTVAMAQTQSPATDVYINTTASLLKTYLTQSTILHEALHNLTGLDDDDVETLLGLPPTASKGSPTDVINKTLVANGCAAN